MYLRKNFFGSLVQLNRSSDSGSDSLWFDSHPIYHTNENENENENSLTVNR